MLALTWNTVLFFIFAFLAIKVLVLLIVNLFIIFFIVYISIERELASICCLFNHKGLGYSMLVTMCDRPAVDRALEALGT